VRLPGSARGWGWASAAGALVSQAAVLLVVATGAAELPDEVSGQLSIYAVNLLVAVFPALGAVILGRFPRHPIGWILVAVGPAVMVDAAARVYAVEGFYLRPGGLPGDDYAAWFAEWNWFPEIVGMLFFVPLLFPDGRLPGPRWRWVARTGGVWLALATIGYALVPTEPVDFPGHERVVQVPAAVVLAALMTLTPVALAVSFASLVVRRRRATGDEREQLRWVLYVLGLAVVGWGVSMTLGVLGVGGWGPLGAVLTLGPVLLLPVSITIAIVKYRLYDIDVLINRTLVYGGLTASVAAAYGVVVLAVSSATPARLEWRWSVLVVAVVAIAAYPLREWMQRAVNRLMYGDRDDPARAMSRLNRRVADSLAPAGLLPAVTETVGQALRLPYVAVRLADAPDVPAATYGTSRGEARRFDLVHQGERVGTLDVGQRSEGEQLSAADVRLLEEVARQVAGVAHAVRLAEDLQRARERLVLAREEERRRLRRDLHDGVGSALAGLALRAGTARHSLPEHPVEAREHVTGLEAGIREAVADIRRIVDDLRPPALDELGVAGALSERVDAILPGRGSVSSSLDGVVLPAAVEVAAYRIGAEALANVARHSDAMRVDVTLGVDPGCGSLLLEVVDDGVGVPPEASRQGVGLGSMRERAEELGGRCEVSLGPGGGTRVQAELPLVTTTGTEDAG
jgi:two-component system NarL family sensor kinase